MRALAPLVDAVRDTLAYLWNTGVDQLFPRRCMGCRVLVPSDSFRGAGRSASMAMGMKSGDLVDDVFINEQFYLLLSPFFCAECMAGGLVPLASPRCRRCADALAPGTPCGQLCRTCAGSPPVIGRVRAVAGYGKGLLDAIHLLKYNGRIGLSRPLGQLLFLTFCRYFSDQNIDLIVPIPLHRSRMVSRGFNQAFLLVQHFEKKWRHCHGVKPCWKVDYPLLKRWRNTASQTGFNSRDRRKNLENAFVVTAPDRVKGRAILLVDDVYTTGSTCLEAAGALRRAGAASVDVLVLARA